MRNVNGNRWLGGALLMAGLVLTGCHRSGDSGNSADQNPKYGDMEIIFSADCRWLEPRGREEMESALSRFPDIDLVYAHNDPMAHGAWLAARAEGQDREKKIKFVGIDANPDEGKKYVREGILDATLEYPTGAAEAIDVALLILNGVKVPKDVVLATTLYTPKNIDEGGLPVDAPGPALVAELRKKHADILKPDPDHKGKFKIGMSQCNLGEPWRVRMNNEIAEAAKKYPQIEITFNDAQNDSQIQRTQVEEFLTKRVDLLIVSPKETIPLTPPVKKVFEAGIPVIVLDRAIQGDTYTCFIGGDNTLIGRTAGRYIGYLLQGKGNIVELMGLMTSTPAHERHDGFVQGLKDYVKDPQAINAMFGQTSETKPGE